MKMAGNELMFIEFLLANLNKIKLDKLGLLTEIGAPLSKGGYKVINSIKELTSISTEDSRKKADIYINGFGISLKQSGANFPYNRLQRADLLRVFQFVGVEDPESNLAMLDSEVDKFHKGLLKTRSRPWNSLFSEADFKRLLKFLMLEGSANNGISNHNATYIIEAPIVITNAKDIKVFDFDEYFDEFVENLTIAIRRQWIGQSSKSEHSRALGLAKKAGNEKWVYNTISGSPRDSKSTGKKWRDDIPIEERRTVYMLFVEKS